MIAILQLIQNILLLFKLHTNLMVHYCVRFKHQICIFFIYTISHKNETKIINDNYLKVTDFTAVEVLQWIYYNT